jgi:Zn finger protein HypA/HybF involved in hydrogenase expression
MTFHDEEKLKQAIKECSSFSGLMIFLRINKHKQKSLKQHILDLNIDISHFDSRNKRRLKIEEIFTENSQVSGGILKRHILKSSIIPYLCAVCGLTQWNGTKITLQIHHVNGINNDHRVENLEFLCPNCHSQTDTYCGRNTEHCTIEYYCEDCDKQVTKGSLRCTECHINSRRIHVKPPKEQLEKDNLTYRAKELSEKYGVHYMIVASWFKSYGIQRPPREHWTIRDAPSKQQLLDMLKDSDCTKVAKILGKDRQTVRKWIYYYDISV